MSLQPPRSTRTYTLFPNPALFLAAVGAPGHHGVGAVLGQGGQGVQRAADAGQQQRVHAPHLQHPPAQDDVLRGAAPRSEEHTSELQSLMRISYAVFCLKTKLI